MVYFSECGTCFDDVVNAVLSCIFSGPNHWKQCVDNILGSGSPCIQCVCDIVEEVCDHIGCNFHCE